MKSQSPPPVPVQKPKNRKGIACSVCDDGVIVKKTAYRASMPVVWIGQLIMLPGLVILILGAVAAYGAFTGAGDDPEAASTAVAVGTYGGLMTLMLSIPFLLIGGLLTMKKKILQCKNCGHALNAS